ncbi:Ger(x)C family spore germination protein [Halalkalibacter urbisdiaboli]|uniref:Ger(x)C family spore germination protein n=1 Tax=Halalkalibacter urbisdiaboli TaxID=1960589 RepID=UPI000B42F8A5|nr:Ger(x)C family spore germination protein [Halalkalibacter urbisdiaboli]
MKRMLCSIVIVFFLAGCLQTRIIDEVAMIRSAAFDQTDKGIKMMVSFPTFLEQGQENVLEQGVIEAESQTTKGARVLLSRQSQKPLTYGQLRVLLFSEQLAKQGIEAYVNAMYRDPSVGNRIFLCVVEGENAGELLEANLGAGEQAGVFISELLQQNMDTNTIPATNMHEFLFSLYNDGRDPYLPVITKNGDSLSVSGTALFKRETFHSILHLEDSFLLKLMTSRTKQALQQFKLPFDQSFVVIENINSSKNRDISKANGVITFTINMHLNGEIVDYTGESNLEDQQVITKIEQSIKEQIETRSLELLETFRDEGIDPIGVGEKYRSTTRNWDPTEWKDTLYSQVQFNVSANVSILQSGAVE